MFVYIQIHINVPICCDCYLWTEFYPVVRCIKSDKLHEEKKVMYYWYHEYFDIVKSIFKFLRFFINQTKNAFSQIRSWKNWKCRLAGLHSVTGSRENSLNVILSVFNWIFHFNILFIFNIMLTLYLLD